MGISGFFGRRNIMALSLLLEPPDEIYAGTVMPLKIVVRNDKRFSPSFLIKIRVGESETLFPVIDRSGTASGLIYVDFQHRGLYKIGDIYISSVFPFNFFIRYRRLDNISDIVVFPAMKKCSLHALFSSEKKSGGERSLDKAGFEAEVLSIRNYHYGDPQKYIHWKASARTGELKTKELSSLSHRPLIIDFEDTDIQEPEERITCITYMIVKSFRINTPIGLRINNKVYKPADNAFDSGAARALKLEMLRELALYGR
jgi:uncharacterized protein (DUF58 family)